MSFNIIDLNTWKRKTHYEHYMGQVRCTYSLTVNIDVDDLIEKLRSKQIKAYPAQIYMISKIVNIFPEFKMAVNQEGRLGYWDITYPAYTIFNKSSETFSSICTPFDSDFGRFYQQFNKNFDLYADSQILFPQDRMPENIFTVSSLPWLEFTGFNLNVYGEGTYLAPIFTLGRYLNQNGKKYMLLSIQVHHAVCDGYHVSRFVEALQNMAVNSDDWL